jgi:predicted MPP superfamily phosphohydrolase
MGLIAAMFAIFPILLIWGLVEAHVYRTKTHRIPVMPSGSRTIRILQISDLHLRPYQRRLQGFLRSLGGQSYDFVFATGDLLGDPKSAELCFAALNSTKARFRCFVLGSADYYAPKFKNYLDYFLGRKTHGTRRNPTDKFKTLLTSAGWIDLTNSDHKLELDGLVIQVTGMDDPYLKRDDRSVLVRNPDADLSICVVHDPTPYLEVENAGYDLMISGHTHGGQVRIPFVGAVVTNSKLPTRYARWASRIGDMWLFVNPGLGTGRYAPIRFLCPPEASVIELFERRQSNAADA